MCVFKKNGIFDIIWGIFGGTANPISRPLQCKRIWVSQNWAINIEPEERNRNMQEAKQE